MKNLKEKNRFSKHMFVVFGALLIMCMFNVEHNVYAEEIQKDISKGNIIISKNGNYTITGKTEKYYLSVNSGITANVTLNNVEIINNAAHVFTIEKNATVNLTINGKNILNGYAVSKVGNNAIRVPEGASLNITKESKGELSATSGGGYQL